MIIPQLDAAQLETARAAATEARRARSQFKESVRSGKLVLSAALDKAIKDESLSRIRVVELLRALPRVGAARSQEIMEALEIAPNRRIRGLGRRQIKRLIEMFG